MFGDMEQQFQANYVRIRVLEQENSTLHSSLVKLKDRAQLGASMVESKVGVQGTVLLLSCKVC